MLIFDELFIIGCEQGVAVLEVSFRMTTLSNTHEAKWYKLILVLKFLLLEFIWIRSGLHILNNKRKIASPKI